MLARDFRVVALGTHPAAGVLFRAGALRRIGASDAISQRQGLEPQSPLNAEGEGHKKGHVGKKPVRRNAKYEQIDQASAGSKRGPAEEGQTSQKGNIRLLKRADGTLYESVDFPTAENYAGITSRRRQQLMTKGTFEVVGKGQNRRITVKSLVAYCPASDDAK
jgi:hypothetical protein